MDILDLHPVLCKQNTGLTWNKCVPSLETGRTNFYQIQNNQHDPSTHDGSQSKHEGTVWGEMADTHSEFHDYKHNTGAAAEEFDADTLTAVYEEIVVTDTLNINNKELVTTDTLITKNRELATVTTIATGSKEFDVIATPATIKKSAVKTTETTPLTPRTRGPPLSRSIPKELRTGMTVACRLLP
jgi:hypothetical protein